MGRVRLVRGHGVQLVRWRAVEHGWAAEVRRGRRLVEDERGWTVLIGGREQRFDRSEWSEFIGELRPPGDSARLREVRRVAAEAAVPAAPDGAGPGPMHARSETLRELPSTRPIMEDAPATRPAEDPAR